jgi:hypothetical protein
MRTIRENAEIILKDNLNYVNGQIEIEFMRKDDEKYDLFTLRTYVEHEATSNPGFFRWLFDDFDITLWGTSLTKEQKEEYETWLHDL